MYVEDSSTVADPRFGVAALAPEGGPIQMGGEYCVVGGTATAVRPGDLYVARPVAAAEPPNRRSKGVHRQPYRVDVAAMWIDPDQNIW